MACQNWFGLRQTCKTFSNTPESVVWGEGLSTAKPSFLDIVGFVQLTNNFPARGYRSWSFAKCIPMAAVLHAVQNN